AESEGMICAEDELGIGKSHDGIMVLDPALTPGIEASSLYPNTEDYIFEIGLTPNRTDAVSHIGVARDLKAWLNFHRNQKLELTFPDFSETANSTTSEQIAVHVEDQVACPRYSGAVIKNVKIAPSPAWLQNKLLSIGLKPINNLVDITNFVMHETGNPLHAFDLQKTKGTIIVRRAKSGETLITLDNIKRELNPEDLVICNTSEPMCIAGVMGGADSGINDQTDSVFLEAAYFNPGVVRKTSKRHGLNSDSSFRFERGADHSNIINARNRAIHLILEICGGNLTHQSDFYPQHISLSQIEFNFDQCRKICGHSFTAAEILRILENLDYTIVKSDESNALVEVPGYRYDVTRQSDLNEEVLRLFGFNQISIPSKLNSSITLKKGTDRQYYQNLISDLLVSNGYFEAMNNSLISSDHLNSKAAYINSEETVSLLNPLSKELDVLRQSLLPGILQSVVYNQNRQQNEIKLFEFGKVYSKKEKFNESEKLVIAISGDRNKENWKDKNDKSDFYTIKAIVELLIKKLGLDKSIFIEGPVQREFGYGQTVEFKKNKLVQFGSVSPLILKEFGIRTDVFYAEFDWDKILDLATDAKIEYKPVPKTQFVRRDFSLLLDSSVRFQQIVNIAFTADKKLLKDVNLFDVYEGKNLPAGKKSYAVSFTFQDEEKTLQDAQIDQLMESIRKKLETELKAELR
ncbi:MAG: phenylalanine--tRNA ligase subunit beta, partial [Crocinitomicaceae bacterium]|nr:phenylalanine--tRNA ligase subunit beta [Crocinitomicaceae bacterium]